jgi:hypothetical protein
MNTSLDNVYYLDKIKITQIHMPLFKLLEIEKVLQLLVVSQQYFVVPNIDLIKERFHCEASVLL